MELLENYNEKCKKNGFPVARPLVFDMTGQPETFSDFNTPVHEITFYNPTTEIENKGKKQLALRVEPKSSEIDAHIVFFEEENGTWKALEKSPHLHLQDPFYIKNIHGYQILGGVEVFPHPTEPDSLSWKTVFYRYVDDICEIEKPFATGPGGMKDIRLIELLNGKIGIFTRPQGGKYGRGKIGYTEIDELADLTPEVINNAKIIGDQFAKDEWGGANDLYLLADGRIGVLGHIAHYDKDIKGQEMRKNYYAMAFVFDPDDRSVSDIKIIANAGDLEFCMDRKTNQLGNVLFSGGLKIEGEKAKLYAGVNDIHAVCLEIDNPFAFACS